MLNLIKRVDGMFARIPESAVLLFVRVASAHVFWASGRTKIAEGTWFTLGDSVVDLFRDEYHLPLVSPEIAAPLAATAEHVLPLLLIAGLFSRFAAAGLIGMTLVIQFFVFPDAWWPVHSLWLGLLFVLLVRGAGGWSLDRFVLKSGQ